MTQENKLTRNFIIGTFVLLYVMVSVISTIHVIDFFRLSNPNWLAITLAVAFEVGAAASLASIIALRKMNKGIVWALFFILTAMQAMGNAYFAYVHLKDYQAWIELFGLVEEEPIFQKRILSIVSGAILPLVALGFIKSLVDYIKPDEDEMVEVVNDQITDSVTQTVEPEITEKIRKENVEKYGSNKPDISNIETLQEIKNDENVNEIVEMPQQDIQESSQLNEEDEKKN
jgi:glucose dehydrogenase